MRDMGLVPRSKYSKPRDRTALINELCQEKRLFIHESCQDLITALRGGWHRKKDDPDEEEEDGYFEHLGDALGYLVYNIVGVKARSSSRIAKLEKDQLEEEDSEVAIKLVKYGLNKKIQRPRTFHLPGMR